MSFLRKSREATFLFIIGAMKSGTTSLAGALKKHPDIALGSNKEPNFFADRGRKMETLEDYLSGFDGRARYCLDASTAYAKHPGFGPCAHNIRRQFPDARYIYLMRDPVARIESQLAHQVSRHPEQFADFEARGETLAFYRPLLNVSSYALQLDQYRPEYESGRIFLSSFESMIGNENVFWEGLWTFLGLRVPRKRIILEKRNPRRQDVSDVRQIRLSESARAMLREALKDDMERLHREYGVDVSAWGF
ncbi:MAG: sulfotransferase [Alphaproteobacteria bacterium]|nr:sulfotransferase [Alphaproteobacteria bacterium]